MGDDVIGDVRRVAADAADEVRAAVVLEALAEHVQPRHGRDAAALAELAAVSSTGRRSHGYATAVAGRPDHGADAGRPVGRVAGRRGAAEIVGIGSAARTSRPSPLASMCSSIRARSRAHPVSAAATVEGRSSAMPTRWPSSPTTRPTSRTSSACSVARSSVAVVGTGRPAAGTARRAPQRASGTSSIVLSRMPIRSSHQKMSMPR